MSATQRNVPLFRQSDGGMRTSAISDGGSAPSPSTQQKFYMREMWWEKYVHRYRFCLLSWAIPMILFGIIVWPTEPERIGDLRIETQTQSDVLPTQERQQPPLEEKPPQPPEEKPPKEVQQQPPTDSAVTISAPIQDASTTNVLADLLNVGQSAKTICFAGENRDLVKQYSAQCQSAPAAASENGMPGEVCKVVSLLKSDDAELSGAINVANAEGGIAEKIRALSVSLSCPAIVIKFSDFPDFLTDFEPLLSKGSVMYMSVGDINCPSPHQFTPECKRFYGQWTTLKAQRKLFEKSFFMEGSVPWLKAYFISTVYEVDQTPTEVSALSHFETTLSPKEVEYIRVLGGNAATHSVGQFGLRPNAHASAVFLSSNPNLQLIDRYICPTDEAESLHVHATGQKLQEVFPNRWSTGCHASPSEEWKWEVNPNVIRMEPLGDQAQDLALLVKWAKEVPYSIFILSKCNSNTDLWAGAIAAGGPLVSLYEDPEKVFCVGRPNVPM